MTDEIIDKAWSSVQPPDVVRWATPRFIKYGEVVNRAGDSMRVQFFDEPGQRGIPNAKWYFVRGKLDPSGEEHLVVVEYRPRMRGVEVERVIPKADNAHDVWISVQQASEMLNMDEKQIRRHIRRGTIIAHKKNDRWMMHRERLRDAATKNGWL